IRERVDHVSVVSPADAARELDRSLVFLNSVIVGSALVALVVASLAVTNTMFTAVVERRREIGLRRVVGATRRQVVGWLVAEAAAHRGRPGPGAPRLPPGAGPDRAGAAAGGGARRAAVRRRPPTRPRCRAAAAGRVRPTPPPDRRPPRRAAGAETPARPRERA